MINRIQEVLRQNQLAFSRSTTVCTDDSVAMALFVAEIEVRSPLPLHFKAGSCNHLYITVIICIF